MTGKTWGVKLKSISMILKTQNFSSDKAIFLVKLRILEAGLKNIPKEISQRDFE